MLRTSRGVVLGVCLVVLNGGCGGDDWTLNSPPPSLCEQWNADIVLTTVMGDSFQNATVENVTACLEAGADVNARNVSGRTPLHWVARYNNNPAVIEALLKAGAGVMARDTFEETALHDAARKNKNPAVIETLLKAGADVMARDTFEGTPLHDAARSNKNLAVIEALLKAGADVNARNYEDETPLHRAAIPSKNDEVVSALLVAGADPYARDNKGNFAFDSSGLIRRFRESGVYHLRRPAEFQAQSTNRISDYGAVSDPKEAKGTEPSEWDGVYRVGSGVTPPTVLIRYKPVYSEEAKKARIEGVVVLSAIVRKDGTIEVLKVVRSLDGGLDENAVRAIKQWKFRPGMKDGIPVDVALNVEVNFSLISTH